MRCRQCKAYDAMSCQCRKGPADFNGSWPKMNPDKERKCKDFESVLDNTVKAGEKIEKTEKPEKVIKFEKKKESKPKPKKGKSL